MSNARAEYACGVLMCVCSACCGGAPRRTLQEALQARYRTAVDSRQDLLVRFAAVRGEFEQALARRAFVPQVRAPGVLPRVALSSVCSDP